MSNLRISHDIKVGDIVMIIAGGNKTKRENVGKTGKVLRFVGASRDRVIVQGLNYVSRHTRAKRPGESSGKIPKEAGIHISNIMYFVEKLGRPVRIKKKRLDDGRKVRGYVDPKTKEFIQIAK